MLAKKLSVSLIIVVVLLFVGQSALALDCLTNEKTYTVDADFGEGDLVDVNFDTPDQLQLNATETPFVFVNVAASARDTIVRINADTGEIMGEYRTAPLGRLGNPSRTTVDRKGNVWTANRDEDQPTAIESAPSGSVVKIGIVIGGIRVSVDPETGEIMIDPAGDYLQGPFDYNTCDDRDGDGLYRTSSGLGDILAWPGGSDQTGGEDGIVEGAEDECILIYQRLPNAPNAHHVSVDADDNVWVGGYPEGPAMFHKLNGDTGAIFKDDSFDAAEIGCGGFGGLVDAKGVIWSADFDYDSVFPGGEDRSALLYYDPVSRKGGCIAVAHSYGLAADSEGFIWNSMWRESHVAKIDPSVPVILSEFEIIPLERSSEAVAVTPADNNVWVARAFGQEVSRLDKDGNFVSVINLLVNPSGSYAQDPTGVAVDANGMVWVTNLGSDNVMRINPDGEGGFGAVDMVVDLGVVGLVAGPDNYSDMTGKVMITDTSPEGTWTVIYDSGTQANIWDTIIWNTEPEASVPEGAGITVEARVADVEEKLDDEIYQEVFNGELLSLTGQFIQIRATLTPNSEGESPILSDLTVASVPVEEKETEACKIDGDDDIDIYDILPIYFSIGATAKPGDPRDWDGDGTVTFNDVKGCVPECTYRYCAPHEVP